MALSFDDRKNFAYSVVAVAPSPATTGTSMEVAPGDGAKFPTPPFNAVIWPASVQPTTTNAEIVRVTAIATDTLTITREQEGTTARTVLVNDQIANNVTIKALDDIEAAFQTASTSTVPVGAIMMWGTTSAPTGWLLCDGSAVSRATYSDLFALWSTTFGAGDGATTFNVPNMKQRIPIGKADAGAVSSIGATTGDWDHTHDSGTLTTASHTHASGTLTVASHTHAAGTLQAASHTHGPGTLAVASHTHSSGSYAASSDGAHTHSFSDTSSGPSAGGTAQSGVGQSIATGAHTHDVSGTTGSGGAHTHDVAGDSGSSSPAVNAGTTASTAPLVNSGSTAAASPAVNSGATASTAPAVDAGDTGTGNPPVLVLNFIVRAVATI